MHSDVLMERMGRRIWKIAAETALLTHPATHSGHLSK